MLTRILALLAVLLLAPSTLAHANARALSLESASLGIFARNVDILKEIPDLTHCCIKEKSTEQSESSNRREEYLRARYMDPGQGRFLGMDPFGGINGEPITLHKYLYANNSPTHYIDPSGNISLGQFAVASAVGAMLGAASTALADYALGNAITGRALAEGAGYGAIIGPAALWSPLVAAGAAITGVAGSAGLTVEVFLNDTSTVGQRAAAGTLLIASIAGGAKGAEYLARVRAPRPTVNDNRLLGERSVDSFVAFMQQNGIAIVGREIYVRSPFQAIGRRFDVVLRSQAGELIGVEIKATPREFRKFNRAQFASDRYVNEFGSEAFGTSAQNSGIAGQRITSTYKIMWAE